MRIRRGDLFLALVAVVGLSTFVLLYGRAFPQAAVKLEITREEALLRARSLAESLGAPVHTMKEAMVFNGETTELLFLQRSLGLEEATGGPRARSPSGTGRPGGSGPSKRRNGGSGWRWTAR